MDAREARGSDVSEQRVGKLAGRVALVTGAGRGLGQGIARAFAREGADIAITYRRSRVGAEETARNVQAFGGRAELLQADISVVAEGQRLVAETVGRFGRLDILVNNAGAFETTELLDVTEESFDRMLTTDFKGPFFIAQAAARVMIPRRSGTIINLASGDAVDADPGYFVSVPYAGAKAALWRASHRMAIELGPHGIRVNVIVPGFIHSKRGPLPEHVRARFAPLAALGRTGEVEDIARAAVFLASDDAAFITGQTLVVDGGIRMH
jgi:NAD(P)-dependent dehydrogenase (short-subunit alcohol dehydrogenase family)